MSRDRHYPPRAIDRRDFLRTTGLLAAGTAFAGSLPRIFANDGRVMLPFENGERELVAYPQKRQANSFSSRPRGA